MFEKGKPLSAEYKKMISETQTKKWEKFRAMIKVCDLIMKSDAKPEEILPVAKSMLREYY